jgi:hypothetical protein
VLVVSTLFITIGGAVRLIRQRAGLKSLILGLVGLVIAIVFISNIPSVKSRVAELTQFNGMENYQKWQNGEMIVESDIEKFNGTSLRLLFWSVSVEKLVKEDHWVFGFSPGDRRAVMNEEYYKIGLNPWYENYNIHNQFVQIFVELGLVGLLIYTTLHLQLLILALKQKNYLLLFLIFGLIIFQLTESIIERNKGIVFFTFFLTMLTSLTTPLHEDRNLRN